MSFGTSSYLKRLERNLSFKILFMLCSGFRNLRLRLPDFLFFMTPIFSSAITDCLFSAALSSIIFTRSLSRLWPTSS